MNALHSFNQWGIVAQFFMFVIIVLFGPFIWIFAAPFLWRNANGHFWWSAVLFATGYGLFVPEFFVQVPSIGMTVFGIIFIVAGAITMFVGIYRSPEMLAKSQPATQALSAPPDENTKTAKQAGIEFEEDVARMFRLYGYNVRMTPESGDHGIDMMISKSPEYAVVQCKFYKERIGEPMIRDFYGAMMADPGHPIGYFITTSGFTDQAYEWAKGKRIILVDGRSFRRMQQESKVVANRII